MEEEGCASIISEAMSHDHRSYFNPSIFALYVKVLDVFGLKSELAAEGFEKRIATKKKRSKRSKRVVFDNILGARNDEAAVSISKWGSKKIIAEKKGSQPSKKGVFGINLDTENNNEAAVSKPNDSGFKKSPKRKAEKERSRKPSKKRENNNDNNNNINHQRQEQEEDQEQAPELPMAFKEMIEELEGGEVKLVIQKELTKSDLNPNNGRFSIPKGKIQEKNFLTPIEESSLDVREGKYERLPGVSVSVLDPNLKLHDNICFKKWEMKTTEIYNITSGWNKLAAENLLEANNKVQLWSFRSKQQLYFALVKL